MYGEISFEKVLPTEQQINILYELLKKRKYFISHIKLPPYQIHENFVQKHPYRVWYILSNKGKEIGSFYLKFDNSIGLNLLQQKEENVREILQFIKNNFSPIKEKLSLIPSFFYINMAIENKELQVILERLNMIKLQVSYKI